MSVTVSLNAACLPLLRLALTTVACHLQQRCREKLGMAEGKTPEDVNEKAAEAMQQAEDDAIREVDGIMAGMMEELLGARSRTQSIYSEADLQRQQRGKGRMMVALGVWRTPMLIKAFRCWKRDVRTLRLEARLSAASKELDAATAEVPPRPLFVSAWTHIDSPYITHY